MTASAYLISESFKADEIGNQLQDLTARREILVEVESAGQAEYFKSAQHGSSSEGRVKVFWLDYNGERELELLGKVYTIYRSFLNGELYELYLNNGRPL